MTKLEIHAEVARLLVHMGCAEAIDIARELPMPGVSVSARVPIVRAVLKKIAHMRKIGGQKALRWDLQIAGHQSPIPKRDVFSIKPWQTESGSLPAVIVPPNP